MKTNLRKGLAGLLCAALMTGSLAGCGAASDPVKDVMGYSGSTVLFTVNGNDVKASDYFFWMAQNADYVSSYYSAMGTGEIDWTEQMDEESTMDDYVKQQAQDTAVVYNIVSNKAKEAGCEFTTEDETEYEEELASAKEQLGGDEAYETWLKTMCLTDKGMKEMSSVGILYEHLKDALYADGGELAPETGVITQYAEDNDLLVARHILFSTTDDETGEALDDAAKAEKKAAAEETLATLKAITDPAELEETFDSLMNEKSEDPGLESSPDGYVFSAGEMVAEFETATRNLEAGQVSDLVESDYGYHIILRVDPETSVALRSEWADAEMDTQLQTWVEEAEIETTETYDSLTTADFYEKLTAYRDKVDPQETEEAATTEETGDGEEAATGETGDGEEAATGETGDGEEAATGETSGEAVPEEGTQEATDSEAAETTEGVDAATESETTKAAQ